MEEKEVNEVEESPFQRFERLAKILFRGREPKKRLRSTPRVNRVTKDEK